MNIIKLYEPFFNLNNWHNVLTSTSDWLMILTLILMECLLSVDNAVVLATQTKRLPTPAQQRKSLIYGLWGAYLFRFIVIGIGTYLINFWEIKLLGGLYLLYLVYKYFYDKTHNIKEKVANTKEKQKNDGRKHHISLFWRTVIAIELMDIVFSIDSVLAALAMSNNPVVILIGGMIGILCMRGIAEVIVKLMEVIPELNTMAYVLITIIAIKLLISLPPLNFKVPDLVLALIIFSTLIITIIIHYVRNHNATN